MIIKANWRILIHPKPGIQNKPLNKRGLGTKQTKYNSITILRKLYHQTRWNLAVWVLQHLILTARASQDKYILLCYFLDKTDLLKCFRIRSQSVWGQVKGSLDTTRLSTSLIMYFLFGCPQSYCTHQSSVVTRINFLQNSKTHELVHSSRGVHRILH